MNSSRFPFIIFILTLFLFGTATGALAIGAQELQQDFVRAADRVSPSVVRTNASGSLMWPLLAASMKNFFAALPSKTFRGTGPRTSHAAGWPGVRRHH